MQILLFLSPQATELQTGIREKNQTEAESLTAALFGIANGRMHLRRGTVGEQTALQGERTIGRLNLMGKVNVQAGATICDPARHTIRLYTDAV